MTVIRDGEVTLPFDPADRAEAGVTFIGRIRSPWAKGDSPRNLRQARESGKAARIELDLAYIPALEGLDPGRQVILLYWMDKSPRTLAVQRPRHSTGPRGTFSLRSPARPNPIALSVVRLTSIDRDTGVVGIDAIDCYDGTPLLDIKPWMPSIDVPPGWQPDA
ncbi:SAM-dependent methyltransferase [Nioella nitratireducens]|uniref:SAM-dependent methyltransferase n=1 Tax=Nioella nitratireducens TaxID=1287720 RepID=UPI0008FD8E0C|nr:SAM-dependent methyltransferase [Nioella nitratireducens]